MKRATLLLASLPLAITVALAGCGRGDAPKYFPLDRGDHWDYRITEVNPLAKIERDFSIDDAGPRKRDGQRYHRRRTSDGTEYWLQSDGKTLRRAGLRSAVEYQPRMDAAALEVMPLAPATGDVWSVPTQPFILERSLPFRERFSRDESLRFELSMRVASLDESVTVPAGTFEHCLKVEGTGHFYILADARLGASEVPVTQTEWYAPDVGLVKLERSETLDTPNIVGGSITMELTAHTR